MSFSKQNMHDSALHYYQKAINFIERGTQKFPQLAKKLEVAKAVIYGNVASSLLVLGDTATAVQYLLQSYQTNNTPLAEPADAQYSALKLINIYLHQQRWGESKILLEKVGAYIDTTQNVSDRIRIFWNRGMAKLYQQGIRNYALANTYYATYDSIKLRFDSAQANLTQNDITLQLKQLEKQYELHNLLKEQKQQQRINTIAWSLVIITIITLSIILWLLQKSRQHVQELKALNTTIEQQKAALKSALQKAETEASDKDKIIRVVAHDLRNPLAAMSSLSNLIIENPHSFSDTLEPIRMIKASCDSSLDLINDLLETADFQQQKALTKTHIGLQELLKHAVEMMRFKADEKRQSLVLQLPETPATVFVNKEKIWRVLANLIANAIKFSQQNSSIEVGATVNDSGTLIYVKDYGVGIPTHMQPYVFDAFTTAKRKGTQGEPTFGLGLSICKQIIEAHGGSIYFESKELVGTCFYMHLPQGV
ncbi:MAG: sensor histidine kinase [Chitinophagaceae bacterium]